MKGALLTALSAALPDCNFGLERRGPDCLLELSTACTDDDIIDCIAGDISTLAVFKYHREGHRHGAYGHHPKAAAQTSLQQANQSYYIFTALMNKI